MPDLIGKITKGDCLEIMKDIPDNSINLIMNDPPYFEVKGEFDFSWKTFEDYLKDVTKWVIECKRVLKENGTLFWWGNTKKIAYSQIILDKYFKLKNSMLWYKPDSQQRQYYSVELSRCFTTHNERVLMYSNDFESVHNETELKTYFKEFLNSTGYSKAKIIKIIRHGADHCFRWGRNQWNMPTKETYAKLLKLPNENNFLRKEYEELRRPFNNILKIEDVLTFSTESNLTRQWKHPTQKTEKLYEALISTCSREQDIILDCFSGSGVTGVVCSKLNRRFICIEKDIKHVKTSRHRLAAWEETQRLLELQKKQVYLY